MSGALAVDGSDVAASATGLTGFVSGEVADCCDSPSVLTAVSEKNIIKLTTNTAMPATDATAHLGIDDFDFLLEAALGCAAVFLCGAGFCGALACGVATSTRGVVEGGASIAGTAKLALQEGHSMVCPASSSGISKR